MGDNSELSIWILILRMYSGTCPFRYDSISRLIWNFDAAPPSRSKNRCQNYPCEPFLYLNDWLKSPLMLLIGIPVLPKTHIQILLVITFAVVVQISFSGSLSWVCLNKFSIGLISERGKYKLGNQIGKTIQHKGEPLITADNIGTWIPPIN